MVFPFSIGLENLDLSKVAPCTFPRDDRKIKPL